MKRKLAAGLIALAIGTSCPHSWAATSAAFTLETSAPPGFVELTAPQPLVADLYYGGRPLGAVPITIDSRDVRFDDPRAVLKLLPPTRNPDLVLLALLGPQPRNSQRVCFTQQQRNCGVLQPDDIGLIYDERRFRIDLFIAPALLPRTAAIEDPYLPESSSEFSFAQNLTGSWSGVNSDDGQDSQSASLFGHSILSLGASGLHSQWSTDGTGDGQIHRLHWTRDYRGKAYSAGLIQAQGGFSSFAAAPYLYGVEYRSSNNSRVDNRYQHGASLEVNMPVRGRVELHRDNRLLHSELLEAGNQLLDTSTLPGGAYELEIRSFDESGRPLARYTQFFTKDSLLPAPGEWQWSIQAGKPAQLNTGHLLPDQTDSYFAQAGLARRVFDNTGLFATAATTSDEQLLELGVRWVSEHAELSPGLLQTSDGRSGHRLYATLRSPWFSLSLAETRLDSPDVSQRESAYSPLGRGFHQRTATLNGSLMGGQLALRYSERDRGVSPYSPEFALDEFGNAGDHLTTLEYRRSIFRNRHWQGEMRLAHSGAEGQQLTSATFQFHRRSGRWSHSTRLGSDIDGAGDHTPRAAIDSSWSDRDLWALDVEQQFSAEVTPEDYYLGSNSRIAGHRGVFSSTLGYRDSFRNSAFNYLGSFSTNIMTDGEEFAWGGERPYDSGVLLEIDGSEDQDFEILVNGSRYGYARGGARSLINLPAFDSYQITLRPLEEGFYDYRDKAETLTLYPGNVARAEYEIQPLILALGRIVRGDRPVSQAKITIGEFTAVTDDMGVFQMEMRADPHRLSFPPVRWGDCKVAIPEQSSGEHWVNLGIIDLSKAECIKEESGYATN